MKTKYFPLSNMELVLYQISFAKLICYRQLLYYTVIR